MKANYESHLKAQAICNVESFKSFTAKRIKVVSNSSMYPNSVTVSMDDLCDSNVDGYILNNQNKEQYALTAMEMGAALTEAYKNKECIVPRSAAVYDGKGKRVGSTDLVRLTFASLGKYKF